MRQKKISFMVDEGTFKRLEALTYEMWVLHGIHSGAVLQTALGIGIAEFQNNLESYSANCRREMARPQFALQS